MRSLRSLPRFFVSPEQIAESQVQIQGEDAHKIKRVLRLQTDDEIAVLDNSGLLYHCQIFTIKNAIVAAKILSKHPLNTEPAAKITVVQSLAKGDKVEQVIKQNTEAGSSAFWLMQTDRCIVQLDKKKVDNRLERYQKIAMEAAEQSYRASIPPVEGVFSLKQALERSANHLRLFFYEGESLPSLKKILADEILSPLSLSGRGTVSEANWGEGSESADGAAPSPKICLFIGPEGGFTDQEVKLAESSGANIVSLGARVLRTETAALVAVSQLLYALEE